MPKSKSVTGEHLNRLWQVGAKHALYREDGKWYHHLERFPGAFFDANGYKLFKTREEYENSSYLHLGTDVNIPKGISAIPGYVHFSDGRKPVQSQAKESSNKYAAQFPTETKNGFSEGGTREIVIELTKRNPKLRARAIAEYGTTCQICGFNFGEFYGELGKDYIEVHHLRSLSKQKKGRVSTTKDVAVVCANCHRILHRTGSTPLSLTELKRAIFKKNI